MRSAFSLTPEWTLDMTDSKEDLIITSVLACPLCGEALRVNGTEIECQQCGRVGHVCDGKMCFTDVDKFYEGNWSHTVHLPAKWPPLRSLLSYFQYYGVTRHLSRAVGGEQNVILDLGCGGGQQVLSTRGQVIGVDVSRASLAAAENVYDAVLAADAKHLPFRDDSFDYVVSVFLLEHFSGPDKDAVVRESLRVLKPGGRLVAYTDTDSEKRVVRWAKKYPELYQRHFVEHAGHVGLESPSRLAGRLRSAGLEGVTAKPKNTSNVLYPMSWVAWFGNEYTEESNLLAAAVRVSRWLMRYKRLNQAVECAVLVWNDVSDSVRPASFASHVLVSGLKPASHGEAIRVLGIRVTPQAPRRRQA